MAEQTVTSHKTVGPARYILTKLSGLGGVVGVPAVLAVLVVLVLLNPPRETVTQPPWVRVRL